MKNPEAPCYKCEDRVVGCHGTCERYQEYAGVVATARNARHEQKEAARRTHTKYTRTRTKEIGLDKEIR